MNKLPLTKSAAVAALLIASPMAELYAAHDLPEIIVPGQKIDDTLSYGVEVYGTNLAGSDTALLMTRIPGGNINNNGPLSGQTQYRGMFGPRMNVTLDGMHVISGGPNWMDPPLHYIPGVLLDSITLSRGISAVSHGSGIGGNVSAKYKSSQFTHSRDFESHGEITARGHDVDNGYNVGGIVSIANSSHRLELSGSRDDGDDQSFGGGDIAATRYERDFIGTAYGFKTGVHEFGFNYRYNNTSDSGNPVLPLDIGLIRTDLFQAGYKGEVGGFSFNAMVNYSFVDHTMNNFHLRQPPDFSSLPLPPFVGSDRREVVADGEEAAFRLNMGHGLGREGRISFGTDGHIAEHNATVTDPDVPQFFVTNYNSATADTYGLFAEWRAKPMDNLNLEVGIRYNRVDMETGLVDAQPANLPMATIPGTPPYAVRMLRDRFNALDREQSDNNFEWVIKTAYELTESAAVELGFARKVRSPSYIERFSWIPLEVNAGLGDGNNYIGDPELNPEVSHQVELGLNWHSPRSYFSPRGYYRRVDDYIQGMPSMDMMVKAVSGNANGDPNPLKFTNVDAELYGIDAMYGISISEQWRMDGVVSYTRGKRRDINDDLYRIAPFNTRLSLSYVLAHLSTTLEGVLYARQENISQVITANSAVGTNAETPGYGLLNLYAAYRFAGDRFKINAGVENLLDKEYIDHLSGFNRVQGSDVPVGERLPGRGRNLHVSLSYGW